MFLFSFQNIKVHRQEPMTGILLTPHLFQLDHVTLKIRGHAALNGASVLLASSDASF